MCNSFLLMKSGCGRLGTCFFSKREELLLQGCKIIKKSRTRKSRRAKTFFCLKYPLSFGLRSGTF